MGLRFSTLFYIIISWDVSIILSSIWVESRRVYHWRNISALSRKSQRELQGSKGLLFDRVMPVVKSAVDERALSWNYCSSEEMSSQCWDSASPLLPINSREESRGSIAWYLFNWSEVANFVALNLIFIACQTKVLGRHEGHISLGLRWSVEPVNADLSKRVRYTWRAYMLLINGFQRIVVSYPLVLRYFLFRELMRKNIIESSVVFMRNSFLKNCSWVLSRR